MMIQLVILIMILISWRWWRRRGVWSGKDGNKKENDEVKEAQARRGRERQKQVGGTSAFHLLSHSPPSPFSHPPPHYFHPPPHYSLIRWWRSAIWWGEVEMFVSLGAFLKTEMWRHGFICNCRRWHQTNKFSHLLISYLVMIRISMSSLILGSLIFKKNWTDDHLELWHLFAWPVVQGDRDTNIRKKGHAIQLHIHTQTYSCTHMQTQTHQRPVHTLSRNISMCIHEHNCNIYNSMVKPMRTKKCWVARYTLFGKIYLESCFEHLNTMLIRRAWKK